MRKTPNSSALSLALALCLLLVASGCSPAATGTPSTPALSPTPTPPWARMGGHTLTLEVAETPEERARGLMERPSLPLHQAMLFVYETEGTWTFWMKNTIIPLDIVWIDRNGEIVDIQTMHPEPGAPDTALARYTPRAPALYVLEMNAGLAEAYRLSLGMKVTLELGREETPSPP